MKRAWTLAALAVLAVGGVCSLSPWQADGQQPGGKAYWIWFPEGDPAVVAPKGTVYFRKAFTINRPIQQPVDEAILDITADNEFTVWVNDVLVGKGKEWKQVLSFDVKKHLVHGKNVIAVEAVNTDGPAGLLVRLGYLPNGMSKIGLFSDGTWKTSKTAGGGWQKVDFDDGKWQAVKVLGPYGMKPWGQLTWQGGGDDRFTVPEGFRVEQAVRVPEGDKTFSLVNMCFDAKGRLLVSREGGPILLCTDPDKNGVLQTVRPYCKLVTNCQGMCWVKDALLLVGNGPQGVGLYRCRDTKGTDTIDDAKLLHKFPAVDVPGYGRQGGMGEHGPHAIIHGPDGWLYLVIGNHAWAHLGPVAAENGVNPAALAKNSPLTRWPMGLMGSDQGWPGSTEDVLLPRLNDGRGHASNLLAPGGTIWRMDHEGKNMSLVAAGFRNHFDAAFAPNGELFTFDSDMEWDENLPWYRAVRICHCPPGADFVWRTGAANTPAYYIDSLPPVAETGRGSPVGLEFYDHHVYPKKYRGAYFMGDWSLGIIHAVHLERDGASYKAKVERFCAGAPMNVTDLAVGPDGAIYFVMGGRGSQGGVYRIVYDNAKAAPPEKAKKLLDALVDSPQPQSAWGRARQKQMYNQVVAQPPYISNMLPRASLAQDLLKIVYDAKVEMHRKIKALYVLQRYSDPDYFTPNGIARELAQHQEADLRAHAIWLLGIEGVANNDGGPGKAKTIKNTADTLLLALKDSDAMVRRRGCEALIRANIEPPVDTLWPLLGDKDRFVRHAARLVLERIDPKKWSDKVWKEPDDLTAWNGIIALCHTDQAKPYTEQIFSRLRGGQRFKEPRKGEEHDPQALLDWLRTTQMAIIHCKARPIWVKAIAKQCQTLFPQKDWRVNRELAILLVAFQLEKQLEKPVQPQLIKALEASEGDRLQQIHYAYCMRLLRDGWTVDSATAITVWYEGTRGWKGGHSFVPFLENIYRDCVSGFSAGHRKALLAGGEKTPFATLQLVKRLQLERQAEMLQELKQLKTRLLPLTSLPLQKELAQAVDDAITQTVIFNPTAETMHLTIAGLTSKNPVLRFEALTALRKATALKPKADEAGPFRSLIGAVTTFGSDKEKWEAILLLRQWTGRSFGVEKPENWHKEHQQWALWFNQTFPKETPLKTTIALPPTGSKHKFDDVLAFLDKERGDPAKGKAIFEKASCSKCHKFGKDGEGVGPDLTTVSKRFKRVDILDSIIYPSKVISDQYRSVKITTKRGQEITGLAAVQGDTVTVLLSDASKVTLRKDEIDNQVASLISVMPERLLDPFSLQEIADLFAFMESEPK
jgi:putative heme-binding domain-containing protein